MLFDSSTRAALLAALAALAVVAHSPAHAQQILTPEGCRPVGDFHCERDSDCGTGLRCTALAADVQRCAPDAPFCCTEAAPCPSATTAEDRTSCVDVSGVGDGTGLCLPDENYCGRTDLEGILACHTTPEGATARDWSAGDCDADGVPNGAEEAASTDPCAAPAPVAIFVGNACQRLTACLPGLPCATNEGAGTCLTTPDGNGAYCAPDDDVLYCCGGGGAACPNADDACADVEGALVCIPSLCAEAGAASRACVTDADGDLVPFDDGDCDRDGVSNGDEIRAETDPCTAASVPPDAGSLGRDGGGGTSEDAGSTTAPADVRFEGGGGCACRARPSGASAPGIALLAALALLALARRR